MSSQEQARALALQLLGYPPGYDYNLLLSTQQANFDLMLPILATALTQATPQWTSEKPTKPGWYWYRNELLGFEGIHHLGGEGDGLYCDTTEDAETPEEMDGQFAGPVSPPEEHMT